MVSVLRKNDVLSTKASFPPVYSKGCQFPSGAQRLGHVRQHLLCPGVVPSLPCDFGWVWAIWLKPLTAWVENRRVLFTERDNKFTLHSFPSVLSTTGHLLGVLTCVSLCFLWMSGVRTHLGQRKRLETKSPSPAPGGWFFLPQRGANEVHSDLLT